MSPDCVLVLERASAADGLRLAARHGVHYLLIVGGQNLVGITCRCDLREQAPEERIGSFMHSSPVTVEDQATLDEAADLMREHEVGCLPVLDWSGRLRGVLTRSDLLRAGATLDDGLACAACGETHSLETHDDLVLCRDCIDERRASPRASAGDAEGAQP